MDALLILEQAAAQLMGAGGNSDELRAAEKIFLDFKAQDRPYEISKSVLERSETPYVLFQAAAAIQEAVIREWQLLSAEDVAALRDYLLDYALQHPTLPHFVQQQVLRAVAAMYKMAWVSEVPGAAGHESFFERLLQLFSADASEAVYIGALFAIVILDEFSTSSRSSALGLTWESHLHSKQSFERSSLKVIFESVCRLLKVAYDGQALQHPNARPLVDALLQLAEQILVWQFSSRTSHRVMGTFASAQSVLFKPGQTWCDILTAETVALYFAWHSAVRSDDGLAQHTRQILVQLANVHSSSFTDSHGAVLYLSAFTGQTANLCQQLCQEAESGEAHDQGVDILAAATLLGAVFTNFSAESIAQLPDGQQHALSQALFSITMLALHFMSTEEDDNPVYAEAFDQALNGWLTMLSSPEHLPPYYGSYSNQAFQKYVESRMAKAKRDAMQEEEVEEETLPDEIRYRDQLTGAAVLGRVDLLASINGLLSLWDERLQSYEAHVMQQQQLDACSAVIAHEQVHWLLLIGGHLMSDEAEGEDVQIPEEVQCFAAKEETMRGPSEPSHVFGILKAAERLLSLQATLMASDVQGPALANLSPQVVASVLWFFCRFSKSYLMPPETGYDTIVRPLLLFGQDTKAAAELLATLIKQAVTTLLQWNFDSAVVNAALHLLKSFSRQPEQRRMLFESEYLWMVADGLCRDDSSIASLPADLQAELAKIIVVVASNDARRDRGTQNLVAFVEPTASKLSALVAAPEFVAMAQDAGVMAQIIQQLQRVRGIVRGAQSASAVVIGQYLGPLLPTTVHLMGLYREHPEVILHILEFFSDVVDYLVAALTRSKQGQEHKEILNQIYASVPNMMQTWASVTAAKGSSGRNSEKEEYLEAIQTLLVILHGLASGEYFDYFDGPKPESGSGELDAPGAVLHGINIIVPLLNEEVLQVPSVCEKYFALLDMMCEAFAERVYLAPAAVQEQIAASLNMGLRSSGGAVARCSLSVLQQLAAQHLAKRSNAGFGEVVKHYLTFVFDWFVLQSFDMDLLELAAESLFTLLCCDMSHFQRLAKQLIEAQPPEHAERLNGAFIQLTTARGLTTDYTRRNKKIFTSNFSDFLLNVRGFLMRK